LAQLRWLDGYQVLESDTLQFRLEVVDLLPVRVLLCPIQFHLDIQLQVVQVLFAPLLEKFAELLKLLNSRHLGSGRKKNGIGEGNEKN
jgi:hypothetical protein